MYKGKLTNINPPRITTEPFFLFRAAALEEKTLIILLVISVL